MKLHKTWRVIGNGGISGVKVHWNIRNWALPVSFGAGIFADEERGDYGVLYSCEYFNSFILGILCFWIYVDWPNEAAHGKES